MGLFDNKDVYCQTCGELIFGGGYISDAKNAYHPNQKCIPTISHEDKRVEFRTEKEIQQDIRAGKLVQYRKLEKSV